ncbi:hypothetical protein ASD11_15715 [Aeromicrobium sp. Root495]|nr:hypothetical protein ASD11_15715 [Aeromicrobium sp. Root495]
MTPRRPVPAVVGALLAIVLAVSGAPFLVGPAAAADDAPDLAVRIDSLSPSVLRTGDDVTLTGSVTNRDSRAWTKVQAYLVISKTPFTSRDDLSDVIADAGSYTGTRVVEPLDAIAEVGDLQPGQSGRFRVRVPYSALGLLGGTGVYPVGVQILATDSEGQRSGEAVGRATTFLPSLSEGSTLPATPTGLVWPFLMPDARVEGGSYRDTAGFVASVTSGRLRHLLDLALTTPAASTTVLLDPALLRGLDDVLRGRHLARRVSLDDAQRRSVARFRDDLVGLARRATAWVLGFDRPDVLGIAAVSPGRSGLESAVDRATSAVMTPLGLTGRRVTWPTPAGVTQSLLTSVRGSGTSPVVVTPRAASQWQTSLGSLVLRRTTDGSVPLLVSSPLDAGVPGTPTQTTLRQRVLAEAALGAVSRSAQPGSRADAIALVDPTWDPGPVSGSPLSSVFGATFTRSSTPEALLAQDPETYRGPFSTTAKATPVDVAQLSSAAEAINQFGLLDSLVDDDETLRANQAIDVASLLGVRWRNDRAAGVSRATRLADRASRQVSAIEVKGPPAFTLSGSEASFPLTISNGTAQTIRVGVRIDSTNPALSVPGLDPVEVGPDERVTVNVPIDVGNQSSSTLSAQLVTPSGREFGEPAVFNVRSSSVGAAVWLAMGAAGVVVVLALLRRFVKRRGQRSASRPSIGQDLDD